MKALVVSLLLAFSAGAQPGQPDRDLVRASGRVRRLALAIGNDAYPGNSLHNAVNDARSMKGALEGAGFTVQLSLNATQQQMEAAIDEFTGGVRPGDIALFFYAGHGLQISDQNYLIPVDFQARTAVDAKYKAYPAQRVQENLEAAGARMQILILDACRNNPFRSLRGGSGGLAAMQAGDGTYIAFATSPGKTAADNAGGRNGLFTGELVAVLREGGLSIDQVFNRVREQVRLKSHGDQLPWSTSSVTGEFYFKDGSASSATPPRDMSGDRELAFWNSIKDENDVTLLEEYLQRYPAGEFAGIAKSKLNRLKVSAAPVGPQAGEHKVNPKDGLTYVLIPPGTFTMGCSPGDSECYENETPSHQVTIAKGFWIGQTEVTQAAYERVIGSNPSHFKGSSLPVESINWDDARSYCTAAGMRLPTDAEWEYAARGGSPSSRYGELDVVAWYAANSGEKTHEVAIKQPNRYGLYDILGNVWEWTADWYDASHYGSSTPANGQDRTLRGGSWYNYPRYARASDRFRIEPDVRFYYIGVRCAGD